MPDAPVCRTVGSGLAKGCYGCACVPWIRLLNHVAGDRDGGMAGWRGGGGGRERGCAGERKRVKTFVDVNMCSHEI